MLNFWVNIGYLSLNPLHVIKGDSLDKNNQLFTSQARILEIDEWEALIETLYDLPEETLHQQQEKMRIKLIMMMLFFLGIRIEELTQLTWSALQKQISKRDKRERWWIFVTGKGAKKKKIPVHHLLLETIKSYRALFKLPEEPIAYDPEPFIPSFRKNKGLGKRQIFKLIKDLAQLTIEKYANTRELDIKKLKDFSPHWLRHASASSQNAAGIIDAFIKANMGHSKIETTHIYIHTDDEARHDAIQKLQL
jgi:integrase